MASTQQSALHQNGAMSEAHPPPYDALVLVSFGGPEGPDDVLPFMENVTRGRAIPRDRLVAVSAHYQHFGGRSPINDQNRALLSALRAELPQLHIYWGNRNWHPYLADTFADMHRDGVRRALAFVTSAFSSYSGCRQYRDDIEAARGVVEVDNLRVFYNHPGFIEPLVDATRTAIERLAARLPAATPSTHSTHTTPALVFTAHSVPRSMADTSDYVVQLRESCALVAAGVGVDVWDLVWQSRSGPPTQPWLEPDISDHLRQLAASGCLGVVVVPVGFISDHMEVVWDLDTQAAGVAAQLGLAMERAATVGIDPRFVAMIRELVEERVALACGEVPIRRSLGVRTANHDVCPVDCCPGPMGRPR